MKLPVRFVLAFFSVIVAGSLFAEDNWWRGTVDDNWSEPGNWSRSRVPISTDEVYFSEVTEPITIYVSGEYAINKFLLYTKTTATSTGPSVTLKKADGAETAKIVAAVSPTHGTGRAIVFDGVAYEQTANDYTLGAYGAITVDNGGAFVLKASSPFFRFANGSSFTLNSGKASFYPYGSPATDTCTFRVNGGSYDFSTMNGSWINTFPANAIIDFRGGTIYKGTSEVLTDPRYLPKGTATFWNSGASGSGGMSFSTAFDEEFSGTLYLTNNANTAIRLACTEATLWGRGSYFGKWFYTTATDATYDIDLARFVLSPNLYSNTSTTFRFRNGIRFGAFNGDFTTLNGPKQADFYGDVVFDTTDAFDGATMRNITWNNGSVTVMPHASLTVAGAGKAQIKVTTTVCPLEKIELEAGSTLSFGGAVNESKIPLQADELKLGAGVKVAFSVAQASVESVKKPSVGSEAGFEVSVSGMTAGTPKAVYYSALADDDDAMPAVTFSGSAGSWQVKRLGGLVYLEDNTAYPELTDATGWKASPADGYWQTAENWVGGAAPQSNERAVFWGSSVAMITNSAETTFVGFNGGFSPAAKNDIKPTTPYVFRGKAMTLTSDTTYFLTGALCWWGQSPVIFENEVNGTGANNFFVYVNRPTFVEFRDKLNVTGSLYVNGDVRLAGAAKAKALTFGNTAGGRLSTLHLYNGGSLTLSAQDGVMTDVNAIMNIGAGSSVSVAGTKLAFNSATTRAHIVDGTLTTTCPYVNLGTQNYTGTGTNAFASATTAAGGAGVTYLAHGLTLQMGGDWETAADETATSKIALDKFETATLAATVNWTYGPKAGVTPTSEDAARALTLGDHAELTIAAGTHTITLAESIAGAKASVKLASGTLKLAVSGQTLDTVTFAGGKLTATNGVCGGDWTTLLTVKKVVGSPSFAGGLKGRVIDNGDGTLAIQAKRSRGLLIMLK